VRRGVALLIPARASLLLAAAVTVALASGCGSQSQGSSVSTSTDGSVSPGADSIGAEVSAGPPKTDVDVSSNQSGSRESSLASGPGPTIPKGRSSEQLAAQSAADAAMIWVGQAYRELSRAGEVTDVGLRNLSAAYSGRAFAAERDVYREYAKNPSALAASPENPTLYIDRVREARPSCFVVQAEFDEGPLLAFPTGAGEPVVAVLRLEDGFWRITALTRSDTEDVSRIDCETT
jgi:hypothetical protein